MLQHFVSLFDVTDSLYASLLIFMLYWADKRIKSTDKKADRREARLMEKVDAMEQRYIEREDKYQEVVNTLTSKIVCKVDSIENEVKEIKEAIEDNFKR